MRAMTNDHPGRGSFTWAGGGSRQRTAAGTMRTIAPFSSLRGLVSGEWVGSGRLGPVRASRRERRPVRSSKAGSGPFGTHQCAIAGFTRRNGS